MAAKSAKIPERNSMGEHLLVHLLSGPSTAPALLRFPIPCAGRKNGRASESSNEMVTLAGIYRAINRLITDGFVTIDVSEQEVIESLDALQKRVDHLAHPRESRVPPKASPKPYKLTLRGKQFAQWILERRHLEQHHHIRPESLLRLSKFVHGLMATEAP